MSTQKSPNEAPPGARPVEDLLRLAGPRRTAPKEVEKWVRQGAYEEWLRKSKQVRRRKQTTWLAAAAGVATVALAVSVFFGPAMYETGPVLATVARVSGSVSLQAAGNSVDESHRLGDDNTDLHEGDRLATGENGRIALALADGISLRLDHNTAMTLVANTRLRLDRGALYVDNGTESGPVRIDTALGTAWDIGTQFEVRYDDDAVTVSVREGLVRLEQNGRQLDSSAGESLRVDTAGGRAVRTVSPSGPEWHWVAAIAPTFDTDNQPLSAFLDWAARETGRTLVYAPGDIRALAEQVVLRGSMQGFTPDSALTAVLSTTDFRHEILEDTIRVELQPGIHEPR